MFQEKSLGQASETDADVSTRKRKSDGDGGEDQKKIAFGFGLKPQAKSKISMNLGKSTQPGLSIGEKSKLQVKVAPAKVAPLQVKVAAKVTPGPFLKTPSRAVASAFNEETDSEEEEMPLEAKMRMRNVGRETPTASGPNSFGKGRLGFCDKRKLTEKELLERADLLAGAK